MSEKINKRIYLDYAAATPIREEVRDAMLEVMGIYGNPSSLHQEGLASSALLDDARRSVARTLGVKSSEIYFTSGATEANNLGLLGRISYLEADGKVLSDMHCVTTTIEHPSVLKIFKHLETQGVEVTYLVPNSKGVITVDSLENALTPKTVLVSIAHSNSEIGSIQKIHAFTKKIAEYGKENGIDITMHTDSGQTIFARQIAPNGLGVDMMTVDSVKVYGPRGFGILFLRHKTNINPILFGGSQEGGLRPGTENIVSAIGFATALELLEIGKEYEQEKIHELRNIFLDALGCNKKGICEDGPLAGAVINGQVKNGMEHIVNISVPGIDSEYILMALDHAGVACSTKAACIERKETGVSHVVASLGAEEWRAKNTLRFSFGIETTKEDVIQATKIIIATIQKYKKLESVDMH